MTITKYSSTDITEENRSERKNLNDSSLAWLFWAVSGNGTKESLLVQGVGLRCVGTAPFKGRDGNMSPAHSETNKTDFLLPLVAAAVNFLITTSKPWKVFISLL